MLNQCRSQFVLPLLIAFSAACSPSTGKRGGGSLFEGQRGSGGSSASDGGEPAPVPGVDASAGSATGLGAIPETCLSNCSDGGACGDGMLGKKEACDDGNTKDSDGCDAACELEPGWLCPGPGRPCIAKECGDGLVIAAEQCDDGNADKDDGCSDECRLEPGFACTKASPTVCHATVCGDGNAEGFEQCDDGNRMPYDGCSPDCRIEPKCNGGECTAVCGDGLKFPQEACDDGNKTARDGCSPKCTVEPGFTCKEITTSPADELRIPVLYRDFLESGTTDPAPGHPDFETFSGNGTKGLVRDRLDSTGMPDFLATLGQLTSADSFYTWWHDTQLDGSPNPYAKPVYLDKAGEPEVLELERQPDGTYRYSSVSFFPLDGLGWNDSANPQLFNGHNFLFNSELRYQFTYEGGEVLSFRGDDDVWVFINDRLAVDLGGLHPALADSITLDAQAAARLALQIGGMYEIAVFQAERHTSQSNYQLTLAGFVHARSECKGSCGDGILTDDEICDDGKNDGEYGGCAPDCHRAAYCGDGQVDTKYGEECDGGHDCTPACRLVVVK